MFDFMSRIVVPSSCNVKPLFRSAPQENRGNANSSMHKTFSRIYLLIFPSVSLQFKITVPFPLNAIPPLELVFNIPVQNERFLKRPGCFVRSCMPFPQAYHFSLIFSGILSAICSLDISGLANNQGNFFGRNWTPRRIFSPSQV